VTKRLTVKRGGGGLHHRSVPRACAVLPVIGRFIAAETEKMG